MRDGGRPRAAFFIFIFDSAVARSSTARVRVSPAIMVMMIVLPSFVITLVVFQISLIGDWLRDMLGPGIKA